jgi:hypothetical protein
MNNENLLPPAKKGEVRNPNGRPKGAKNWSTIFKKYAKLKIKPSDLNIDMGNEDLANKKITQQDIVAIRLWLKAMKKCDARDIELLINRMDGLLKQPFEMTNTEPININFNNKPREDLKSDTDIEINE